MNFFKDYRKRLAWFGILLVAIVLSQTPMALLGLLVQTEIPSIWSGIIISLVSILVLAIFLYGAHKSIETRLTMSPDQMEGISVWASKLRSAIGVCERTIATSIIPNHASRLR